MKTGLFLLVLLVPAHGEQAVVRLPSHGGSGVVIWTAPGRTLILSSAHMASAARVRIDAPNPRPVGNQPVGARVVAVDRSADLMLIVLGAGPLPYVCPVAPPDYRPGRLVSVGYDNLKWPAVVRPAHLQGGGGKELLTRELPWHGRSGGGLIDVDSGLLLGIVSGYDGADQKHWQEVKPGAHGVYASTAAIQAFLRRHAPEALGR